MTEEKKSEVCLVNDLSDVFTRVARMLGISDGAQEHFRQSRIEMLKGIRKMVDDQIDQVTRSGVHKGTHVIIE